MESVPDFEIIVYSKGKRFRMKVYKIYEGDSLQRFKVEGGKNFIVLQSNLPQLRRGNSRDRIDWKLLEGDFSKSDPKDAAEALQMIIDAIEYRIKEQPMSFEDYRKMKKDK